MRRKEETTCLCEDRNRHAPLARRIYIENRIYRPGIGIGWSSLRIGLEVERTVAVRVVLEVRTVVDGDLGEAGGVEELHDDVRGLGEVPLAVGRRVVRAGQAGLELVGVRSVADPAAWPAIGRREVAVGRQPVKSA